MDCFALRLNLFAFWYHYKKKEGKSQRLVQTNFEKDVDMFKQVCYNRIQKHV